MRENKKEDWKIAYRLATQGIILWAAKSAPFGNLLEVHNNPDLLSQNLHFNKIPVTNRCSQVWGRPKNKISFRTEGYIRIYTHIFFKLSKEIVRGHTKKKLEIMDT